MDQIQNNDIFNRVPQGPFGFSFLSWQGNQISFEQSNWVIGLILLALFLAITGIFLFKKQLANHYLNHTKSVEWGLMAFASFIFFMYIFRIAILIIGNYPNLWEILPFHFCRGMFLYVIVVIMLRKIHLINIMGLYVIGGAFVGLVISDLSNSDYWIEKGGVAVGYDSYIFWDYFIIHSSAFILPAYMLTISPRKITKSNVTFSFSYVLAITISLFLVNFSINTISIPKWEANWFYLAPDAFNGIDDVLKPIFGPLASWPFILLLMIGIGIALYSVLITIYFVSFKFDIDLFAKNEKKIKIVKSPQAWLDFKNSTWL